MLAVLCALPWPTVLADSHNAQSATGQATVAAANLGAPATALPEERRPATGGAWFGTLPCNPAGALPTLPAATTPTGSAHEWTGRHRCAVLCRLQL